MTPQEIKDAALAQFDANWFSIVTQQHAFNESFGRYWQGLATHSTLPADGASVAPDLVTAKPSDEFLDWSNAELPATMNGRLYIDNYSSTAGNGYTAFIELEIAGDRWRYGRSFGPLDLGHDWQNMGAV